MGTRYLTIQELIALNKLLIDRYSPNEQVAIINQGMLASAANRPKQSAFGEDAYRNVFEKSAALFESVAKNHAFANANKRTAFAAMHLFLTYNGYELIMGQEDAEEFTVDMVLEKYTFEQIVSKIEKHSRKK